MILVELSKLLKDGKIDRHASRSSQFLQLVDAVFDEAAKQMTIEEQDEDTGSASALLYCLLCRSAAEQPKYSVQACSIFEKNTPPVAAGGVFS